MKSGAAGFAWYSGSEARTVLLALSGPERLCRNLPACTTEGLFGHNFARTRILAF